MRKISGRSRPRSRGHLADLIELGLAPSFKKMMGLASTRVKFLGFIIDSELMRMFVTGERLDKLETAATWLKA